MTDPKTIRLVIEGPPPRKNWKHRVHATRRKSGEVSIGRHSSPEYEDFCGRAAAAWEDLNTASFEAAPVLVNIVAYWPSKRRADIDAPIESTLDALTKAGVWDDDAQVCCLHAHRDYDKERPRVEVEIVQLEDSRSG